MKHYDRVFIDGQWIPATGADHFDITEAATGTVIARISAASRADLEAAVDSANRAFPVWSQLPPAERATALRRIAQGLKARSDEIARSVAMEVGMPLKLSNRIQVGSPILAWEAYADLAMDLPREERIGHSLVVHEPVGVVGCITPWNYPLHQVTAKVAAALAAGCTVVLKPSEVAPISAFILAEVVAEAGVPAGTFNLVCGEGATIGEALAASPRVDMISFTGSTNAGKRVAAVAADTVKRVSLELGGKSPSVVLDDADLTQAVRGTIASCFLNSGQTCSALTRLLVPEDKYEQARAIAAEACAGFTLGNPLDPATRVGPLVSARQQERVVGMIRKGLDTGADLIAGGSDPVDNMQGGFFVRPTVLGRVASDSPVAQEEIFGPVLVIQTYRDEEEAVRLANGTQYGLAAAVWSGDEARARQVAGRIRAGQIDINGAPFNPAAPFGGFKQSGHGRENGSFGLAEFLEPKSIQLRSERS
ncbi:aldehyde dehydrogenase family protein [Microvirga guangxiensis]|uniref:aldehyde dehydrogenase (NAD(+)) n=1 Tax=Microvirga guangxiensis TaxID=549386 RepID=A0A1G5KKY2_9HYPH|nr:aldehyde dehydrogenase family protein [Microvirga guangxiensis]SCZ01246.1 Acyl-CoA reductase [Microvirga guangxiensis]